MPTTVGSSALRQIKLARAARFVSASGAYQTGREARGLYLDPHGPTLAELSPFK